LTKSILNLIFSTLYSSQYWKVDDSLIKKYFSEFNLIEKEELKMEKTKGPFCQEEINASAIICKHCHQRIYRTRQERLLSEILERSYGPNITYLPSPISRPSVTACGASCYASFHNDKRKLNECLEECKLISALSLLYEKLHAELILTFTDIIWQGGDIDPVPLEREIRQRFSQQIP
jgi:hypothetical protein